MKSWLIYAFAMAGDYIRRLGRWMLRKAEEWA